MVYNHFVTGVYSTCVLPGFALNVTAINMYMRRLDFRTLAQHSLLRTALLAGLLMVILSGCATRPPASDPEALQEYIEANDPIEPFNRAVFSFNQGVERVVFRPLVAGYRVLPIPVRRSITGILGNLNSPTVFANDVLQGEFGRAGTTLGRMIINTTVGLGGIFDVAKAWGLEGHREDFGQTLAVWGLNDGPYLVLPFLGPSNPRDGIGFGIDTLFVDPIAWYGYADNPNWHTLARTGVTLVDRFDLVQDNIDELEKSSIDFYATLRESYRQNRAKEIRNGRPAPLPDFGEDDPFAFAPVVEPAENIAENIEE